MITNKRQKISISNKKVKKSNSDTEAGKRRLTILDLPDEILLKIFSHLKSSCLLRRVFLVCKAWKALAEDPSLWKWKSLTLDCERKEIDFKVLSKYQFIQNINIYYCTLNSRSLRALSQLSRLRSLMFYLCSIPNFKIKSNLRKLRLTSLYLYHIENSNRIFNIIDPSILKNLEIITFDDDKENFIENLKKCTQLEDLSLDCGFHLYDESVNCIIDILSNRLVKLNICGESTENAFFNFTKCLKLSSLTIETFDAINDSILFQIMNLSTLKYLSLKPCNSITSEGMRQLFMGDQMSNLEYLILKECTALCDSDLITVASCCKKLIYLDLEHNAKVTDVGVSALLNNCLKIIELYFREFYNLKGTFLLEIAEKNLVQNIQDIYLSYSYIERNYVVALETARPKIRIKCKRYASN